MLTPSRLKVGVDVPWVTSWSEEKVLGARPCATTGGRMAVFQTEHPGFGRPVYSENHFRRQRESVLRMLCPMCGAPTPEEDRYTLTAKRAAAGELRARGLAHLLPPELPDAQVVVNAGSVAPLHRGCADRSAVSCPHLSADPNLDLMRFPDRWLVVPLLVSAEAPAQAHVLLAQPNRPPPVVAFMQLYGLTEETDRAWRRRARRAS